MGKHKPWEPTEQDERQARADLRAGIVKVRQKGWSATKVREKYAKFLTKIYEEFLREVDTYHVRRYNNEGFPHWYGPYYPLFPHPESRERSTYEGRSKVNVFYEVLMGMVAGLDAHRARRFFREWDWVDDVTWPSGRRDQEMEDHLIGMSKYLLWKMSGEEDKQWLITMAIAAEWLPVVGAANVRPTNRALAGPTTRVPAPPEAIPPGRAPAGKAGWRGPLGVKGPISPGSAVPVAAAAAGRITRTTLKTAQRVVQEARKVIIDWDSSASAGGALGRLQRTTANLQNKEVSRSASALVKPDVFRHSIQNADDVRIAYGSINQSGSVRLSKTGASAQYGDGVYAWPQGKTGIGKYIDIEVPPGIAVEKLTFKNGDIWYRLVPEAGNNVPVRIKGTNLTAEEIDFATKLFPPNKTH